MSYFIIVPILLSIDHVNWFNIHKHDRHDKFIYTAVPFGFAEQFFFPNIFIFLSMIMLWEWQCLGVIRDSVFLPHRGYELIFSTSSQHLWGWYYIMWSRSVLLRMLLQHWPITTYTWANRGCFCLDNTPQKRRIILTQQIRDIVPMLGQCWSIVYDAGPTLNQHWDNVSCLLGSLCLLNAGPNT